MKSTKKHTKDEAEILRKSAKISSSKAQRSSRAMGLTIKVISNNEVIEKLPDGSQKVIKKIESLDSEKIPRLKKGTILCRK